MTRFNSSYSAVLSAGATPGRVESQNTRPCTYSMRKKAVPITPGSSHSTITSGTGTPLVASACITLYSRSTAWADGSSAPGGLRRST